MRFDIHPRKLEQVVESIFTNMGYKVELTVYAKDHGVDLFLIRDPNGDPVAVQVKRFGPNNKIGVSAIREFLGAMLLNRAPSGIFVTTSTLQGAHTKSLNPMSSVNTAWNLNFGMQIGSFQRWSYMEIIINLLGSRFGNRIAASCGRKVTMGPKALVGCFHRMVMMHSRLICSVTNRTQKRSDKCEPERRIRRNVKSTHNVTAQLRSSLDTLRRNASY